MRILYVVECEIVSRNTAVDSSGIMSPCDTVGSAVVFVRISASIADKRDVVSNKCCNGFSCCNLDIVT